MDKDLENIKKAMFINWAWSYNPEILTPEDLDWFYEFILRTHVETRKKQIDPNAPAVVVAHSENGGQPPPAVSA